LGEPEFLLGLGGFEDGCEENQRINKRTAEYPPAMQVLNLSRANVSSSKTIGITSNNVKGIAGRSNKES